MSLIKKFIRKLYHLIWFLSVFFIVSLPVNAAVNVTPPMDRYATILLDGSTTYYNTSFWNVDDNFWSGGYIPQVTVPSSPSEPSSYAWIASGTSYCGTDGGNITGYIGSANGSFYNYLQKIELHSDSGRVLCSFTNANNEGTLVQFNCTSSNLSNFSIHYKYKNVSGVTVGQYPILGRTMSVTCNTSDSSSAINNQTQQIIQNDNSNTQQIIQNDNSNNQHIIDNNNQNTQDIINSSGSNTQSIIDNQNENSNKEIESQKVCKTSQTSNKINVTQNKVLNNSGQELYNDYFVISQYYDINDESNIKVISNYGSSSSWNACFYNNNKELLSCVNIGSLTNGQVLSIPNGAKYFRSSILKSENRPLFEIKSCSNGNQALDDSINGLNDSLNDETAPNLDLSDLEVSSDTPISDLITMPLTILNTLIQTLDGSCTNYTIPFFYNNSLTFPCFTISDYLGNTVTNYIDLFICFYMCYNIAMLVVSVFEDITSLRDIYDSMYVPKHADMGYQPKHAKGGGN